MICAPRLEPIAAEFGVGIEWIDIDTDPLLEARYNELRARSGLDGVELCHYHLDDAGARRAAARVLTATLGANSQSLHTRFTSLSRLSPSPQNAPGDSLFG